MLGTGSQANEMGVNSWNKQSCPRSGNHVGRCREEERTGWREHERQRVRTGKEAGEEAENGEQQE